MKRLQPLFNYLNKLWKKAHLTQILILTITSAILFLLLYFGFHAFTANVQSLQDGLSQETVIYDKDGEQASEISINRVDLITIDKIPDHVQNAVIAIEDHRFYEHKGFDIKGIMRAFFKNILSGRITGGGSTITQQLTKNALLSPEKTYKRKVEELFLAVEIEKKYRKKDILQMYLNQVYFGNNAWGINSASQRYFSKSATELTISEAALLAGLLKAPSALDPTRDLERSIERRNVVLGQMLQYDFISKEEYDQAIKDEVSLKQGSNKFHIGNYPYYVDAVLDEAINKYGLTQEEIFTRGYKIYTEIDQNIQTELENVYRQDALFPPSKNGTLVQSGAVLLDPATGGVRALVGGRGERVFRGFNRATHLKAQPGSTLKPLAVYVPALEEGYRADSILKDEQMSFNKYKPENVSKTYRGEVPLYEAVEQSLNIPAVWLLNEISLSKGIDSLQRFGIPIEDEDRYLGIALGGMHKGISPLQLAEAYATFPNEGKRPKSHTITKIVGPTGNVIAEFKEKKTRVTSKEVANEMTAILLNVVETGTGKASQIPNVRLAGKTGSTQLPYADLDGTKDQWFVGYTGNLVGAIWLGFDQTDRDHYLTGRTSNTVLPIFKKIMEGSLQYVDDEELQVLSINAQMRGETITTTNKVKEQTDKVLEKVSDFISSEKVEEQLIKLYKKYDNFTDKLADKLREIIK